VNILSLRTDKPQAELGLYKSNRQLAYITWQAERKLAETLNDKIDEILNKSSVGLGQVQGIVVFKGPGSFTGLRICMTVANALAYSNKIPVIARSGDDWLQIGIKDLLAGKNDKIAVPEYGSPVKTTQSRK
jgi:tRNA threonylcarbamoyladenosine biosynthesis protein TsaB